MATALVPEDIGMEMIDTSLLPRDWREEDAPAELRKLGDDWLERSATPVLRVPSAIVPEECNYLINPSHADFRRISVSPPVEYIIDGRLIRTPRKQVTTPVRTALITRGIPRPFATSNDP